jgi:hemerythrin-like domain-containing protein
MKPTDILMQEHRVIEQVLNCLERMVEESEEGGNLIREHAEQAIAFFRAFADQCHHGKEEDRFFPLAHDRGIPREGGPIGQMLLEHTQGRAAIKKMDEAIPGASGGDPNALKRFIEGAREYIVLLRDHIQKEDHCLFPMADRVLSPEDQEDLMASFEYAEKTLHDPGTHEKYLGIANDLADYYGVQKAMAHAGGGCCHHAAGGH